MYEKLLKRIDALENDEGSCVITKKIDLLEIRRELMDIIDTLEHEKYRLLRDKIEQMEEALGN